jgi:asparagine synthetase B (glutamine-hydrolysing)
MSDFLVTFNKRYSGEALLQLLRLPYGEPKRAGRAFDLGWGSLAVLGDPVAAGNNVQECEAGSIFATVGDVLVKDRERLACGLFECADSIRRGAANPSKDLAADPRFAGLNGAFAAVLADQKGPSVITDPLGSVQVYAGANHEGFVAALGTHPDLVARVSDEDYQIDPVSVFEFLNVGTPCFPHTMHTRVTELGPGRMHIVSEGLDGHRRINSVFWWPFPEEVQNPPDEATLAAELGAAFTAAVRDRCGAGPVGVTLSGGLDSRLVMAAVPDSTTCIGLTFCDVINREAHIACRVAKCYGREWVPLFRDNDYVARTAMETVRFIGCEGDWVNAHGIGFTKDFARYGLKGVFSGLLMNNNVKGYYAADVRRVPRWGGLLPASYEIAPFDYVNELKACPAATFADGLLEAARARRKTFLDNHPGLKRQSVAEWLDGYPFSQASDNTAWVAERRLMPVRLPAMDRRLLDIACRIPMRAKAGGELFNRMAVTIFRRGARIPNANDGVRPGSGHASRLVQRACRKFENRARECLAGLGLKPPVPHSWHDYQRYWRESEMLRQLILEHGNQLRRFEGQLFQGDPRKLIEDRTLPWEFGFRLVQLAIWSSLISEYRIQTKAA